MSGTNCDNKNFLWCLTVDISSVRLLRSVVCSAVIMCSFSARHSWQRLDPAEYAGAFCWMLHSTLFLFSSFNFQTCLDNSVEFLYRSYQKFVWWLAYRCALRQPEVVLDGLAVDFTNSTCSAHAPCHTRSLVYNADGQTLACKGASERLTAVAKPAWFVRGAQLALRHRRRAGSCCCGT